MDYLRYPVANAVHPSDPRHRIGGFEGFGHAIGFGELSRQAICHLGSFSVDCREVFFQFTRKQQIGV